ncbi:MAG: hypothetical protein ABJA78_09040 [Ferruginibacter sp.]
MKRVIIFTVILFVIQPLVNCVAYNKELRLAAITGLLTNIFAFAVIDIIITSFSINTFLMISIFVLMQLASLLTFFRNNFNKAAITTAIGGMLTVGAAVLFVRFLTN